MQEKFLGAESSDRDRKELDALKKEIERKDNSDLFDSNSKKEIDMLHANILLDTQKHDIDDLKQQETIEIRSSVDKLKSTIDVNNKQDMRTAYEAMSEDEIEVLADQGRNKSVNSVTSMIENTSRIPDIIKRNA